MGVRKKREQTGPGKSSDQCKANRYALGPSLTHVTAWRRVTFRPKLSSIHRKGEGGE